MAPRGGRSVEREPMNVRPSGPGGPGGSNRGSGRAGTLAAAAPTTRSTLARIRERIASGYYDRDDVRDQVVRCIRAELERRSALEPRD